MAELVRSLAELLGPDARRSPMAQTAGVSGAVFERVSRPDGEFVLKRLDRRDDWTMRAMGDLHGVTRHLWERGILDALPECIHQPIVGVAVDEEADAIGPGAGAVTWLLMRDVGEWLVPDVDDPLPLATHRAFLAPHGGRPRHLLGRHADGRGARPRADPGRQPPARPVAVAGGDRGRHRVGRVIPRLVGEGWDRFPEVAHPSVATVVRDLADDPTPIAEALAATPGTLVHGNWKFGNLGTDGDGRTVLLDWEGTGRTAATLDLSWYLAINCRRIPESKEAAIAAYPRRAGGRRRGHRRLVGPPARRRPAHRPGVVRVGEGAGRDARRRASSGGRTGSPTGSPGCDGVPRRRRRRVGRRGRAAPGRAPPPVRPRPYSAAAARWAAGPDRLYYRPLGAALVRSLVDALGRPLAGERVLDAGAGTGAVTVELEAVGARVVALDRALGMLAFRRADRPPAAVADACALPVRPGSVAAVAAGCLLAHLPEPAATLGELAAALAPGGVVAASAFPSAWHDPLKAVVEAALVAGGWQPPPWYRELKGQGESATGAAGPFRGLASAAGLTADVREVEVPVSMPDAEAVADWRLGMAQTAPWVDTLEPPARDGLRAAVAAAVRSAVGAGPVTIAVPLLVLLARP